MVDSYLNTLNTPPVILLHQAPVGGGAAAEHGPRTKLPGQRAAMFFTHIPCSAGSVSCERYPMNLPYLVFPFRKVTTMYPLPWLKAAGFGA